MTSKISFPFFLFALFSSFAACGVDVACSVHSGNPSSAKLTEWIAAAKRESAPDNRVSDVKRIAKYIDAMNACEIRAVPDNDVVVLAGFLRDRNDPIREYAAISLGNMKGRAKFVLPKLEDALKHPTSGVVFGIATLAPESGAQSAIQMAITKINNSP